MLSMQIPCCSCESVRNTWGVKYWPTGPLGKRCTIDNFNLLNSKQLKKSDFMNLESDWRNVLIIVSNNECKNALNKRANADFAAKTGRCMHWYWLQTQEVVKKFMMNNFITIWNQCISYQTDEKGDHHVLSCIMNAPTATGAPLQGFEKQFIFVLLTCGFVHLYSHKTCTIKWTQVPIMPAFAMTAHKAQGQTMDRAIVDLESCFGTESLYIMISKVRSLDGSVCISTLQKYSADSWKTPGGNSGNWIFSTFLLL